MRSLPRREVTVLGGPTLAHDVVGEPISVRAKHGFVRQHETDENDFRL